MNVVDSIWHDDMMERKASSDFLASYLLSNDHVHVLNVNSPWGAGKSFFLKRWAQTLSQKHVCISFNAWESDYSSEPLVALVTCIEQQTSNSLPSAVDAAGKTLVEASSTLIRKAAPLIMKGLIRKISGVELDELLGEGSEDVATSIVESLVEEQAATEKNVLEFKSEVVKRLQIAAKENNKVAPAFIFIDELDRCRPTYAIELLERVKHFFELDECRFIIASDSEQLAHSIRAVYGQGFASEKYLNRFFDVEFRLDNTNKFAVVAQNLPVIDSLAIGINVSGDVQRSALLSAERDPVQARTSTVVCNVPGFTENAIIIVGLSKYFKVELREIVNYIKQINSASASLSGKVHFFWLAFLVFCKSIHPVQYSMLFSNSKQEEALKHLDESGEIITFSFTSSLVSITDLVSFYLRVLSANRDELSRMSNGLSPWQGELFYDIKNERDSLRLYKSLVELAHRIS